jgi:hypothetical protein
MRERPIRPQYRGPQFAAATTTATGGKYLGRLIAEADCLRLELGYQRFSHLAPWCDSGDPLTCDAGALERLIERLCILWADR